MSLPCGGWKKKVVKEQVAIPCDTVYKSSSLLRNGRSMLITEGTNGLAENTYEELWSGTPWFLGCW